MDRVQSRGFSRMLTALAFFLLSAQSSQGGVNSWTALGPEGGTTYEIIVHPTNSSIAYLTSSGGLFKTSDGGESWRLLINKTFDSAPDVALDLSNPDVVIVVGAFLNRSTDGGQTFTQPSGIGQVNAAEFSRDGSVVYASGFDRFFRSTDRGITWQQRTNLPAAAASGYVLQILIDPNDANTVFIRHAHAGLLRSRDGGLTWDTLAVPGSTAWLKHVMFSAGTPARLWVQTADGISYSDNQGTQFAPATFPQGTEVIACDPNDPTLLYATTFQDGLFRSTNGGAQWTRIWANAGSGWINSIGVDRQDSNHLFIGTTDGVLATMNGGATWARRTSGFIASSISQLSASGASDRMYFVVQGGALHRLDGGNEATTQLDLSSIRNTFPGGPTLSTWSIHAQALNPDRLFIGTDRGVFRSLDAGATWLQVPTAMLPQGITQGFATSTADPNLIIANANQTIYRSIDAGVTWSPTTGLPAYTSIRDIAFGATTAYASLAVFPPGGTWSPSGLYRSLDGGATWEPANAGIETVNAVSIALDPINEARLIISADTGFKRSLDRGRTWSDVRYRTLQGATHRIAMDPTAPTTLYASASGRVDRSIDDGESWEELRSTQPPAWIPSSLLVDPRRPNRVIVGTSGWGAQAFSIEPDLSLAASATTAASQPGSSGSYSFTSTNVGPHATHAKLIIQLPSKVTNVTTTVVWGPGTCTTTGGTIACEFHPLRTGMQTRVDVSATFPEEGEFAINASISADQPDPAATNNSKALAVSISNTAPAPAPTPTPTPTSPGSGGGSGTSGGGGGGGGGGQIVWQWALAFALLLAIKRSTRATSSSR